MGEIDLLIKEYAKNPLCNYEMDDADVMRHEGNFICGDDITVYLKIIKHPDSGKEIVADFSYAGNPSTVSLAAASFLSEFIIGETLDVILTWNYATFEEKWFEVSPRRKRAAMIALLGVRNAIYTYRNIAQEDDFDDIID